MAESKGSHTTDLEKESTKPPPWWKRLWTRTGLSDKTLWDFLQLLIVPLALAGIGYWFTAQQDARQGEIEEQRAQDAALQAYLDQISTLLLEEKDLRNERMQTLLRARTLTVLGRLDARRKTQVVQFLDEAKLISNVDGKDPIVGLSDADLSGADLSGADLSGVDVSYADLSYTDVSYTDLSDADLSYTDLSETDLSGADVTDEQLVEARTLQGATMPNGQKYEEWLKSKGSGEDGENSRPS